MGRLRRFGPGAQATAALGGERTLVADVQVSEIDRKPNFDDTCYLHDRGEPLYTSCRARPTLLRTFGADRDESTKALSRDDFLGARRVT